MSKYLMIKQALYGIGQAEFQIVCNRYLGKNYGGELHTPGTAGGKTKTKPGKPDTYVTYEDQTYILAEVTTQDNLPKSKFAEKLKSDLNNCLNFSSLGITAKQVRSVVLCCNSDVDIPIREELNLIIAPHNIPLTIITLQTLVDFFYSIDKPFARDFWNVPFETGQVLTKDDFLAQYCRKHIATPLDNIIVGRERELAYLKEILAKQAVTIISGPAGVGKSRLAMQAIDDFVVDNNSYKPYYIISKPESIIEDLLTFLIKDQSYIILIDDANRQLENVLSILHRAVETDITIKIILTVREYAKEDVEKAIRDSRPHVVNIGKLQDDVINQILYAKPFAVINNGLRDRIVEISQGNARLAIMAAEVIKDNQDIALLKDVTSIYDAYFQSIIDDQSIFNSSLIIQVLGFLSFFHSVDRDVQEELDIITDFGISLDDFNQSIQVLEGLELVDVNFNSIVKIGDQVLGTYFFYQAFIRLKVLNVERLITNYFPRYLWRVRDTFIPAINTFGIETVFGASPDYLLNYLQRIKTNYEGTITFYEVFGPYLPRQLFLFISQVTSSLPDATEEFQFLNSRKHNQANSHDHILRLLEPYYKQDTNNFLIALGLSLQYIHKKPSLLDELLGYLKSPLYAAEDDLQDDFSKQKATYSFLKNHLNDSPAYKLLFYYIFQHVYLNSSFNYSLYEIKDGNTIIKPVFEQLRQGFWNDIIHYYKEDQSICFDLLIEYIESRGRDSYVYLADDQLAIIKIIKDHLIPKDFGSCYFVQSYFNLLSDRKIEISAELKSLQKRFNNTDYRRINVLSLDRNARRKRFNDYVDFQKQIDAQILFVKKKLAITDLKDFIKIFNSINKYLSFKYWHKINISFGFTVLLENSFKYDLELGYSVLTYYLSQDNALNLIPGRLFNVLFQLESIDQQKLYAILKNTYFKYKQEWIEKYWECLPSIFITNESIDQLLSDFSNAKNYYELHIQNFQRYEDIRPGVIADLCQVLVNRYENDNEYIFKVQYFFFEQYPYIINARFELAKTLFFLQDKINHDFDPRGGELFYLVEKDIKFFTDYIDHRLELYKKHYSSPRAMLNRIWEFSEAEQLVYESLVKLVNTGVFSFGIDDFACVFFVQLKEEFITVAVKTLLRVINEFHDDPKMLSLIWNIARNRLSGQYAYLLQYWIQANGDFEVFKKCDWTNNSFSYSGDRQIWADFRAKDYQFIYDAIAALPEQYKYVEYHAWLRERMAMEMRSGDWERKRLYRGYR